MPVEYSFYKLCKDLLKPKRYVQSLQSKLELYIPRKDESYTPGYRRFLQKGIALRTYSVPLEDITDLFKLEKKIMQLMHADSQDGSPTWYLDCCAGPVLWRWQRLPIDLSELPRTAALQHAVAEHPALAAAQHELAATNFHPVYRAPFVLVARPG